MELSDYLRDQQRVLGKSPENPDRNLYNRTPIKIPQPIYKTSDGGPTDYYKIPEGSRDLQDLIEHKNMNFSIGNIFKACYRLGEKKGASRMYDLNKMLFFLNREIERIVKSNN